MKLFERIGAIRKAKSQEEEMINILKEISINSRDISILKLFSDKRDPMWKIISKHNKMDSNTIMKHISTLDIDMIQTYQPITVEFVEKYLEDINPFFVTSNRAICNEEYEKIVDYLLLRGANINEINWIEASSRVLSLDFISRYIRYIRFEFMYYDYQNSGRTLDFIKRTFKTSFEKVQKEMIKLGLEGTAYLIRSLLIFDTETLDLNINQKMKNKLLTDAFIDRFMQDEYIYSQQVREVIETKLA